MVDGSDLESSNKAELDERQRGSTCDNPQSPADDGPNEPAPEYATGTRLALIMFTIFVSTILVSLKIGIIATAIPGITADFHRLDDVGWYGSATFILAAATSPLWGKLFKYLNVKWTFLGAVGIFLVGSVVAAAALNSVSVIIGRALHSWGASGVQGGTLIVIVYVAPPRNHPLLIGTWMAVFMVSTILGPVIGGAFTSESLVEMVLLDQLARWRSHRRSVVVVPSHPQVYPECPGYLEGDHPRPGYPGVLLASCRSRMLDVSLATGWAESMEPWLCHRDLGLYSPLGSSLPSGYRALAPWLRLAS
ncbi:hypothetical protein N8T08_001484 [Aspergillus melleus]|uniref:Uncharacterized protein n=1 Tax=Aspergillus melleus TaxID=138277 RepID=A0ACC3B9S6_9EURO|nr:hypothetical protein N8T08_001484 [Aspergillus melleus]